MPIIYSFRRCPYAIRARMAIFSAKIEVELREVDLKCKPEAMLLASPKATVPVLVDGLVVIDESLDIMLWALDQNDPEGYLGKSGDKISAAKKWIDLIDGKFKHWLDCYKYHDRFPEQSQEQYRDEATAILDVLEQTLKESSYLLGATLSIADIAVFPFIRQFAFVDIKWFESSRYSALKYWLDTLIQSPTFTGVMGKNPLWHEGDRALFVTQSAVSF